MLDGCVHTGAVYENTLLLSKDISLDFSRGVKNCRLREEFFLIETC